MDMGGVNEHTKTENPEKFGLPQTIVHSTNRERGTMKVCALIRFKNEKQERKKSYKEKARRGKQKRKKVNSNSDNKT